MRKLLSSFTYLAVPFFAACSTIDIQDVEPDKLKINVNLTQTNRSTAMDVFLKRGVFDQAVTAKTTTIEAELDDGQVVELVGGAQKGRYGFRE